MSSAADAAAPRRPHPLRPLDAAELTRVVAMVRAAPGFTARCRFVSIILREPDREGWRAWRAGGAIPRRRADVVLYDRAQAAVREVVVGVDTGLVESWVTVPGAQPALMIEEALGTEGVVKADRRWQEAMRRRGVDDLDLAHLDAWPIGFNGEADAPERRLCIAYTWMRTTPDDHHYAHPVDGVVAIVDLDLMEVVEVEDHGLVPIPEQPGAYTPPRLFEEANRPRVDAVRDDEREIRITQPDGPSFTVDDHSVRWQKWSFEVGWNVREGLVLHDLRYDDAGTTRPLFHRLSMSEMAVPYADPGPNHFRKIAFDEGEIGLGLAASSLELGCDCLGEIRYFDAPITDQEGEVHTIANAICLHEEDHGVGWKHVDFRTGHNAVSRSRRLVISTFVNVGNYDYGFFWYLYQDGTIELEVKLTGVISTGAYDPAGPGPAHGVPVAPGLYGPHHQHFFCVRVDPWLDGPDNTVVEVDSTPLPPGPDNPYGTGWQAVATPLRTEAEARRQVDGPSARHWKITNPSAPNDLGTPVAYRLEPGANVGLFVDPDSHHGRRAAFAAHHLWVTPHRDDERYAAGAYPYQSSGGDGLPHWSARDRSVDDTDIVLWYVFGAHHIVRPEDWPVMPVARIGFQLRPDGFFTANPALDAQGHGACHPGGPTP